MCDETTTVDAERAALLKQLIDNGLLIESGVTGVFGQSGPFERVRDGIERWMTEAGRTAGAEQLHFPPIIPRIVLERVGYLGNFPHLAGSVFGFEGSEREGMELGARAAKHEDWSDLQTQTELMLTPAACYPVYPAVSARGPLTGNGVLVDIGPSWVFRHEPSIDPARRQIFHMHELVRIGSPEQVSAWREEWTERALQFFLSLGLDVSLAPANDPFFGRQGRLLASSQRERELKLEFVIPIVGPEPTACASSNYAVDHLTHTFGLAFADGAEAHSACLAFGHERLVLALMRTHGFDIEQWPADVRAALGLA